MWRTYAAIFLYIVFLLYTVQGGCGVAKFECPNWTLNDFSTWPRYGFNTYCYSNNVTSCDE